jgi:Domain of unknown function (DUF4352)
MQPPPNSPQSQEPYQGQPQQTYYPQQPRIPPKKTHTSRKILMIVAVIVVVLLACGGSNNTGTVVGTATTSAGSTQATSAPTAQPTFKVGQIVSVGGTWQITVLSAKTSTGSEFNTPQKPGDVFLVITVVAKNISGQSQTMSSFAQWSLQDTTGQRYNVGFDTAAEASLDGAVAAGRLLKGTLVYEVPKTVHNFSLNFQNDIISSDQSIWDITV